MGKRGPRASKATRLARGSAYRPKGAEREMAVPEPGPRVPPRWLDAEARRVWDDLSERLDRMAVLGLGDYYALAVFCDTWSRWRKARAFIEQHGESHLVRDRAGNVKGVRFYPHVRYADRLAGELVRMARELGITPTSRGRAAVVPHHVYPEWDRYLAGKPDDVQARTLDPTLERPARKEEAGDEGGDEADDEGAGEDGGGDDDQG